MPSKVQGEPRMTPQDFLDWRRERRLTQGGAAVLLGVGRRTVVGWEAGRADVPHPVLLACRYLSSLDERRSLFTDAALSGMFLRDALSQYDEVVDDRGLAVIPARPHLRGK